MNLLKNCNRRQSYNYFTWIFFLIHIDRHNLITGIILEGIFFKWTLTLVAFSFSFIQRYVYTACATGAVVSKWMLCFFLLQSENVLKICLQLYKMLQYILLFSCNFSYLSLLCCNHTNDFDKY